MADFDLAIIGGGINGVGIARDAAGRGLRVLLVEQNDLASGTSSTSSKMIHGGLRYLEHFAFRLVREALAEREVMLRMAPHVIRPLRILLPPVPGPRSALLLRLGLFVYDNLGGREILPPTKTIDLTHHVLASPLKRSYRFGFEYSDCAVDDSRLVVLTALDAAERGAAIRTRTRCVRAERGEQWNLVLNSRGRRDTATARIIVNAAGPWIAQVAETVLRTPLKTPARLVKGSHIVVKRNFGHEDGYLFQGEDRRVVFALPFAGEFTLIGTTDENFVGDVGTPAASPEEVTYLCNAVNVYFRETVMPDEVVLAFAGVRCLYDDHAKKPEDVTRDYVLALDEPSGQAPLLTVYGGKITTYRRLAEAALSKVSHFLERQAPWTAGSSLPGGDFPYDGLDELITDLRNRYPFLTAPHARRLARTYGTRTERVLGQAATLEDLGPRFTADLTGAEVRYLMHHEWAQTSDDVLWRRTKLGLIASGDERKALAGFMAGGEPSPR
jgi:glycerol-3-phosphate dehydrogenase